MEPQPQTPEYSPEELAAFAAEAILMNENVKDLSQDQKTALKGALIRRALDIFRQSGPNILMRQVLNDLEPIVSEFLGSNGEKETSVGKLNDDEIIELKRELLVDEDLRLRVCTLMARGFLEESRHDAEIHKIEAETQGASTTTTMTADYQNEEEFEEHVGGLAARWSEAIVELLELPDSQWLKGSIPPGLFADALRRVKAGEEKAE